MIIPYSPDLGKVSMLTNIPWLLQIYFATYPPHSVLLTISHFSFQYIFLSYHPVLFFSLFLHSPISLNFAFLSTCPPFLLSFPISTFYLFFLPVPSSLVFSVFSHLFLVHLFPFCFHRKIHQNHVMLKRQPAAELHKSKTLPPRQKREEELLSCLEVEEQLSVL